MTPQQLFFSLSPVNVHPLISGLTAYYKLDESSGNAIDIMNGNTGTRVGTTQSVTGKINTCYTFNGTSDYINCGRIMVSRSFTFAAWIKVASLTTPRGIICPTSNFNIVPYFRVEQTTGLLALAERGVGGIGLSSGAITVGVFTHVAVTYTPTGVWTLYINGSADGTGTSLKTWQYDEFIIGSQNGAGGDEFFSGQIDEVGIWTRALTANEISVLYNSGNGTNGFLQYR